MKSVLVDSNVVLDVVTEDPNWGAWSRETLARCADEAELVINPLIYAEVSSALRRSKRSKKLCLPIPFAESRCRGKGPSWRASASSNTGGAEAPAVLPCLISTSVPMRL